MHDEAWEPVLVSDAVPVSAAWHARVVGGAEHAASELVSHAGGATYIRSVRGAVRVRLPAAFILAGHMACMRSLLASTQAVKG